jgi:hypothetical protein
MTPSEYSRLTDGFDPIIRLDVGSFKSKFGPVKKPVLSMVGKSPIETDETPWDDEPGI